MMTIEECKAAVAALPIGIHYELSQDDDDLIIWSSLSHDNEPWPNATIEALASALSISVDRFESRSDGCDCCGYGSEVIVVDMFAAPEVI